MTGPQVIVLPGSGGGSPDVEPFRAGYGSTVQFRWLTYPSWRWYLKRRCFEDLIAHLASQIEPHAPNGPLHILGFSLGGHLGYAVAMRLHKTATAVAGFCVVDAFAVSSAAARPGWMSRFGALLMRLLVERQFGELAREMHPRVWRTLLRLAAGQLVCVLTWLERFGVVTRISELDPLFEHELTMRLLLRLAAPGIAALDNDPEQFTVPTVLLRTAETASSDAYWKRRIPDIEICDIPGNHPSMMAPENMAAMGRVFEKSRRARVSTSSRPGARCGLRR